jgi:hypothetical protein
LFCYRFSVVEFVAMVGFLLSEVLQMRGDLRHPFIGELDASRELGPTAARFSLMRQV